MNLLVVGLLIFSLLILFVFFLPLTKHIQWQKNYRQQQNVALYQQQMAHNPNAELQDELSRRLLTDEKQLENKRSLNLSTHRFFIKIGGLLSLLLIAIPFCWYFSLERYTNIQQAEQTFIEQQHKFLVDSANNNQDDYILVLQNRLRQAPNDAEQWIALGQAYMKTNEWENALVAFSNAERLQGSNADILGLAATALYLQAGEKITPKVQQLVDTALQQDPTEISSLSLLATDAYLNKNYARSLMLWQQILDSGKNNIDRRGIIQRMKRIEMQRVEKYFFMD